MTGALLRLQGVWFPTHRSVEGRLTSVHTPALPAPRDAALLTILGDTFHVSVNAEYYWTGGRLRLVDGGKVMWFFYPGIPAEYDTSARYDLAGDELLLCSRRADRPRPGHTEYASRYVRVGPEPTPEMLALFESIMRGWTWAGWDWDTRSYPAS